MDGNILNIGQATEFLGVSEKTLIKLLREEHIPARKIGREWRFSREALLQWLAAGDSLQYISQSERYMVSTDTTGKAADLFARISDSVIAVKENGNNVRILLNDLDRDIRVPEDATLRISYKQQRDIEKLEFKIFWEQRDDPENSRRESVPLKNAVRQDIN